MASQVSTLTDQTKALQEAYSALNRGEISAFVRILDPQVERVEPEGFPGARRYEGIEAVAAHFTKARDTWAEGSCEPREFKSFGDRIIVSVYVHVRLKHEAEWREGHVTDVYTFRDGKVLQFYTFTDEEQALEWAHSSS